MNLRLLAWLKGKLVWRALTAGGRWAGVLVPLLVLVVVGPLVFAGSWLAWHVLPVLGAGAFTVVFGASLVAWFSSTLTLSTLGTALDPARVLRYPIAPVRLFAFEMAACTLEPLALACLTPPLVLAAAAGAAHGALAAAVAVGGVVLLALGGAAMLQLLVAALDRLLRHEWTRVLAGVAISGVFLFGQTTLRTWSDDALPALLAGGDTARALARLAGAFEHFWPASLPARWAAWAVGGDTVRAVSGAIGSLALTGLAMRLGARLLARNALREVAAAGRRRGRAGSRPDPWAALGRGLPRGIAVVMGATARQWVRSPRGLFMLLFTPTLLALYYLVIPSDGLDPTYMGLTMALASIAQSASLLYANLGPGLRTLHLLPLRPRDIVWSQNVLQLIQVAALGAVLVLLYARTGHAVFTAARLPWLLAGFGCALLLIASGNLWSILYPVRMPRGFGAPRHADWRPGLAQLAVLATGAGFGAGAVALARLLAPEPARDAAGVLAATAFAGLGGIAVLFGVRAAAAMWLPKRERMIEVLARDEP